MNDTPAIDDILSSTILRFPGSTAFIKAIAGSPGGGKSVSADMDGLLRVKRRLPDRQGVRLFRL